MHSYAPDPILVHPDGEFLGQVIIDDPTYASIQTGQLTLLLEFEVHYKAIDDVIEYVGNHKYQYAPERAGFLIGGGSEKKLLGVTS